MKLLLLVFAGALIHCLAQRRECGENEEFHDLARFESCYPSCDFPSPIECPYVGERNACRCKPGFFRDSHGRCTEDCSHEPCYDPNAIRKSCGVPTYCLPSCDQRKPPLCESKKCVKNVCECKPGYVFDFDSLYCIPASECGKTGLPFEKVGGESQILRNKKILEA